MESKKDTHILMVVGALIEAAADKDQGVREAVGASLRKIAKKCPNEVLENAAAFRKRNPKVSGPHLVVLLRVMEQICNEHLDEITPDAVHKLVEFGVEEMTRSPEYLPDVQMPASGILVALGQKHCIEVMEGVLKCFNPGVVPHYTVMHTMANLASANVFGIVPFVKATLGTMLPMIGMLRNDAMKQVFAFTLGKFSDAVLEYLANIDQAPDPTVHKNAYSSEISIAYDVLVSSWLHIRDPKVCSTVLHAVGPMFSLLPPEKVSEQIPRLVPTLLGLYRRNIDPYPVTQCLASVLFVAISTNPTSLEPLLDNLLSTMFEHVCTSPDYAQPSTVKNHFEVLRCFDRIAGQFCDRVVELLIQQLKNNNERERIKSLFVITHLVNSCENLIKSRATDLIAGLRNMLGEHSIKVKKVLLKTIVAFAYRGYLEGNHGKEFIEFIVKHCCPVASKGMESNSIREEFLQTCANTLYLLATTVPQVEETLWPLLLQFFLASQYTAACSDIARCLAHLASKHKEEHNFAENSTKNPQEIPGPYLVLGRCLALLGSPIDSNRGIYVLNFMKKYAPNVNRHLKPLWEQRIPELVAQLEGYSQDDWQDQVWEDLVLEFVSATLSEVDEEKWTLGLGVKLMEQLPLYVAYPLERGMLYKCLAIIVCHTTDKQFVNHQLEAMLSSMRQHSANDSKACSRAVGICARHHVDMVLQKLEALRKDELSRKSSRLLSFMKDVKHEGELDRVRLTLLLCYGEVALEAPGTELLPRLEHAVTEWVLHQLNVGKDLVLREAALRTLGSIAESFHPNRNSLHIVLQSRSHVLQLVLNQLQSESWELAPTVLRVATAFIKLPPSLPSEERVSILKVCFDEVFLAADTNGYVIDKTDGEMNNGMQHAESQLFTKCQSALVCLVQQLLLDSVTPATLDDMFTLLEPWFAASASGQRAAALETLNGVLQCYINNMKFGFETPSKFGQTGLMLGRIVPRCTDPSMKVRRAAITCVRLVLCLAARYEGHMSDYDNDLTSALAQVQSDIQTNDPTKLFQITSELAQILCSKMPHFQLIHFTDSLLDGLMDPEPCSSSGASVVLNSFFKSKGGELYHQVTPILNTIIRHLSIIRCPQTRTGSVRAVLSLANHHPKAVVGALLLQPIPFDTSVSECWKILAQDPVLSADIIEQFVRLVASTPLYEVQHNKMRIAVLLPLAAISAMQDMFHIASMQEIAVKRFAELFSMFLICLGCYVGVSPPIHTPQTPHRSGKKESHGFVPNRNAYKLHPWRVAQEAFNAFLLCSKCEAVAESLLCCNQTEVGENTASFIEVIPLLARSVCVCMPRALPKLVTSLNQYGTSSYEPQRITVAAFFAELVHLKANGQIVLLESIVGNLLNCLTDPSPIVRRLCLKGLSAVSQLDGEQRSRHSEAVLSALIQGLDDHGSGMQIPLEAMRGFSQMLQVVDEEHIQNVQVTVALRIKPYFEKEDCNVRAVAVRMFGDLAKFSVRNSKEAFQEQVNGNLVCLLLHLDDDDMNVVKACKYALKEVGPLLGAERLNAMMQGHLIDAANLHYLDFMADLAKILVEELPELVSFFVMNALSYLKSSWPSMRGNAAMFIGLLYGSLPENAGNKIPLDTVCARLMQLLRDEDKSVGAKAAQALSSLFVS
ncbi:maestro heat-like repeat-containing protein family member 1 [Anabrus simplex]|uniref:maestro heat-like repeat-containing protein family member 1 n=1 Tax=Anabrus simplex TaxID=316456 RepID=UPI0035A3167D